MATCFQDLCRGIRNNDPNITKVEIPVGSRSGVQLVLKALAGNTHVTDLILDVSQTSDAEFKFHVLLQYLQQTKYIQSVELVKRNGRVDALSTDHIVQCVRALARNASLELNKFDCLVGIPDTEWVALLQAKSHYLKLLILRDCLPASSQILQCIGSLAVLNCLYIRFYFSAHVQLALKQLYSHSCLRQLILDGSRFGDSKGFDDDRLIDTLSSLLRSGVQLERFELHCIVIGKDNMENLIHGMKSCGSIGCSDFMSADS
jgi:hypothetical protein